VIVATSQAKPSQLGGDLPMVLGHDAAGIIEEVGQTKNLKGDISLAALDAPL
jgi:Zn-dependent alcohol dehydrogenase